MIPGATRAASGFLGSFAPVPPRSAGVQFPRILIPDCWGRYVPKKDPLDPPRCAQLLAALAAPERLKVVRFLVDGPQTVTEIVAMLGIPAVNVSHHLTVLKHARLLEGKRQGRFVWYSLCPGLLEEAVAAGISTDALNLGCCRLELPSQTRGPKARG